MPVPDVIAAGSFSFAPLPSSSLAEESSATASNPSVPGTVLLFREFEDVLELCSDLLGLVMA
jgi:hypothetical protein